MYHLSLNEDKDVSRVCKIAFPEWNGRKVRIAYNVTRLHVDSYWSGGSRSYYVAVNLATGETQSASSLNPLMDKLNNYTSIPEGFIIVEHSIFQGKDLGLIIHTSGNAPMLPEGNNKLTDDHKLVLLAHRGLVSSYSGIKDYRAHNLHNDHKLPYSDIERLRKELTEWGYLRRNGITDKGKNIVSNYSYNHFKNPFK
jgi:hypothetical protein